MIKNIMELYQLFEEYMPVRVWWDAETPWEIAIGSILVQNTNWHNVDYSVTNLRKKTNFQPEAVLKLDLETLQDLIRPSGFFKSKSLSIVTLFEWFQSYDFNLHNMGKLSLSRLRKELLAIRGIGPETADVLLIFVLGKAVFVADKYAQRLVKRLGIEQSLNYQKLQQMIQLPADFSNQQAKNFHGWIIDYSQIHLKNEAAWQSGFLVDFKLFLDD